MNKYIRSTKIITTTVTVKPLQVMDGIVELVTANSRPFTLLEDSGFEKAFGGVITACGLSLNRHNIKDAIRERSLIIQDKIRQLKNRLVSLKINCVSRLDRSFIGINMQCLINGKMKIFTLAVGELSVKHSGSNLKKIILSAVEGYGIKLENIYSIIADNGANMIKAIDLISETEEDTNITSEPQDECETTDMNYDPHYDPDEPDIMNDLNLCPNDDLSEKILKQNWSEIFVSSMLLFFLCVLIINACVIPHYIYFFKLLF